MTTRIREANQSDGNVTVKFLFELLDFLRTASPTGPGWTVPRSSNGTTGGAGDNIAAFADLQSAGAWFVLQQPDGGREFLWTRVTNEDSWSLTYSPGALFIGGTSSTAPTATDQVTIHATDGITNTGVNVTHITAEDAAPYGWAVYQHTSGNFTTPRGCCAFIPITAGLQPGDTDAMVYFYDGGNSGFPVGNLTSETTSTIVAHCCGLTPGAVTMDTIPAMKFQTASGTVFPDGSAQDQNADDVSCPVPFGRRSALPAPTGFKGWTDYMRWNGTVRAPGETFASLTRISFGAVSFPWDGTTTPSVTG